jgi:hypothetical protein
MSAPPARLLRDLEANAGWALLMATFSGFVLGCATAAALLGQLSCIGGLP